MIRPPDRLLPRPHLLILAAALPLVACGGGREASASAPPAHAAAPAPATSRALVAQRFVAADETVHVRDVALAGSLVPRDVAVLRAQVAGTIVQLAVERGSPVRRGQALVRIDARGTRAEVAGTEAAVAAAEAALQVAARQRDAARTLYGEGAIAPVDLASAEAAHRAAVAQLASARARATAARESADRTVLVAPFDGVVADRRRHPGEGVSVGDEILTVVATRTLRLDARLAVDVAARVRVGTAVRFALDGAPAEPVTGSVVRVEPLADSTTRQVGVSIEIANPGQRLLGGQYARGRVELDRRAAAIVPRTALVREAGPEAVVWIDAGGSVARRVVQVVDSTAREGTAVIVLGIAPRTRVLERPGPDLRPGQPIGLRPPAARATSAALAQGTAAEPTPVWTEVRP